ncbi:uncharacterized protein LOC130360961 [Hyla sarda]|uniref:uncharacterized protein LOC130360961 n=1 Tax=Hyla sarda TaxID=327740 RepID=UPI0024C2B9BB|nr:uncharacterized protein LOC130360961 [Hyla sarda]
MDLGFSLASYFVLVLTLLYILNVFKSWNKNHVTNFPPGPRCLPLIGNLHLLDLKKLHVTFLELAEKYGPVFSIQMGMKKMVVLAGYETVKEALVNRAEEFGERGVLRIFKNIDKGMGIAFSNGKNWKIMRRFTITTLRDFGMGKSTIEQKIADECAYLTTHFASFKGKPFDNFMILNAAVANIIVAILLGNRMDYDDPQFRRLLSLTNENVRLLGSPKVSLFNLFPFLGFIPGGQKTVKKNVKELYDYIRRTFVEHLKDLDENDQRSFIDAFLVRQKEETGDSQLYFHTENLTKIVRNLFSAGMETTSTTLRWGLLLMIKYPKIQEKVQEEITRVIGSAQPMYSHRGQMPCTNAVIHEIQRFSDIIPLNLGHETAKDVTFKGYFIPKGTYIIPLLTSVLKDKTQFEKPEEFYPQHFLDSKGDFIKKDAFMPFSAGRRVCAGETLARMELFIFFTSLLQKFTFRFPPGVTDVDLTPIVGITSTPQPHMICAIQRGDQRLDKTINTASGCQISALSSAPVTAMDLGFSLAFYFVLVLTLLYILNVLKSWNKNHVTNFPPGPRCLPLIGDLHLMDLKKLNVTFMEFAKKYGPVYSVQMGMKKMVVLAGYETVKDALVNHAEDFGERGIPRIFKDMDKGMGLVSSNGENWKTMRRFTITTLRDFGMGKSTIEEKIVDECANLTTYFASYKGKPFDNFLILNAAVANIIVAILLGNRMDYDDPQFERLLTLINENIRLLGSPMVSLYNFFPILGLFPGSHKTIIKNVTELYDFIRRTFVKHLKNLDENDQRSFIDVFLVRQKEETESSKKYFNNENLTVVVRSLFSAGMETTSTTLRWGLLLMIKYPKIQEKVQEEISRVVGSAQPMYSHRGQMPYTNAVIHEIQRFSDILPLNLGHETAKDVTFKGYFIPKGTYIIPLLTSVLKDKTQFEKPGEFYPQHFIDSKGNFIKKDAFMPFSAGRRACAGETLARMQLFIFFTSLLQKFTFHLPPGVTEVDMTPIVGITQPPKPHMICAVPRF